MHLEPTDDDLAHFAAHGVSLPPGGTFARIDNDGASIWYADYGSGRPVVLLHGGMGHSGNFAWQLPALLAAGYRVIAVDSRGHGHSTSDGRPYAYELMATDVVAVLDTLGITQAAMVGWSDGACIALALARQAPRRVAGIFFFACNVDRDGTLPFVPTPTIERCLSRHREDYVALSATPDQFDAFMAAVGLMQQTQPDYTAADLAAITVPVTVALGEHDEFIRRDHAAYIARTIPGASFVLLPGVGHFAPLQRPVTFNAAIFGFMAGLSP